MHAVAAQDSISAARQQDSIAENGSQSTASSSAKQSMADNSRAKQDAVDISPMKQAAADTSNTLLHTLHKSWLLEQVRCPNGPHSHGYNPAAVSGPIGFGALDMSIPQCVPPSHAHRNALLLCHAHEGLMYVGHE